MHRTLQNSMQGLVVHATWNRVSFMSSEKVVMPSTLHISGEQFRTASITKFERLALQRINGREKNAHKTYENKYFKMFFSFRNNGPTSMLRIKVRASRPMRDTGHLRIYERVRPVGLSSLA